MINIKANKKVRSLKSRRHVLACLLEITPDAAAGATIKIDGPGYDVVAGSWEVRFHRAPLSEMGDFLNLRNFECPHLEFLAARRIVRDEAEWEIQTRPFTGLVREVGDPAQSTTFVEVVNAADAYEAAFLLAQRCAHAWSMEPEDVECFGVFEGACSVSIWDDEGIRLPKPEQPKPATRKVVVTSRVEIEVPSEMSDELVNTDILGELGDAYNKIGARVISSDLGGVSTP